MEPPADVRVVIDGMAPFVAKSGAQFVDRILAAEGANAKFAFLDPSNEWHAYFNAKVEQARAALHQQQPPPPPPPPQQQQQQQQPQAATPVVAEAQLDPAAKARLEKERAADERAKSAVDPFPEDVFTVPFKRITSLDVDTMRLTALYAAKNGESFLVGLRTREANNPQFAFLKPFHSVYPTFEKLLDVYKRILAKPDDVVQELEALASDRGLIIKRLTHKWQWEEHLERERKRADGDESFATAPIDWHDFVVVEQIDFAQDEGLDVEQPAAQPAAAQHEANGEPAAPPAAAAPTVYDDDDDDDENIKIVKDYTRLGLAEPGAADQFQICPICKREVAIDEMQEHMRVELMDPKWREKKEALQRKTKEATLASNADIAKHLKGIAARRTDIFAPGADGADKDSPQKAVPGPAAPPKPQPAQAAPGAPGLPPPPSQFPPPPPQSGQQQAPGQFPPNMPPPPGQFPPQAQGQFPPPPQAQGQFPPNMPPPPGQFPPQAPGQFPPPPQAQGQFPPNMPGQFPPNMPPPPGQFPPAPNARPASQAFGSDAGGEPAGKRPRTMAYAGPVSVSVTVPADGDKPEWNLNGQTITVQTGSHEPVKAIKERIQQQLSMPVNKQKLQLAGHGFLADSKTLADFGVAQTVALELSVKKRR